MCLLRPIFLLFIFLAHSIIVPAQKRKIDSLQKQLRLIEQQPSSYVVDTSKIEVLNALVWQMTNFKTKLDTAMVYAQQALSLSEKLKWNKGLANGYASIARVHKIKREQDKAIENYQKALDYLNIIGEKVWIANCLYFMGQTYFDQGNYPASLDYLLQALRLNEEVNHKERIATTLSFIGDVYVNIGDNNNALDYYHQALKKNEELKNKPWIAINMQGIAGIYNEQGEYDKSIDYFSRVLKMMGGNMYSTYMTYKDLADVHKNKVASGTKNDSSWEKASDYYSRAINTANQINDSLTLGAALSGMGSLYIQRNMIKEADEALNRALNLLKDFNRPEYLKECYYNLSVLDSLKGDWKNSLIYFKLYTSANDSLFNKRKSQLMARAQVKYETDKKQDEIEILNKDNELKSLKIQQLLVIIAAIVLLLICVGALLYYRNKRIKRDALKQISEAKLASLKSLMDKHFIFSSLHSIDTFLMNNNSEAASDYLVKYSKLIRTILEMSNQAEVSLDEEVSLCRSYLDLEKIRYDHKFDYAFVIDHNISGQHTQFPSMLLQPLVENAVKHGIGSLTGDKKGFIRVLIEKQSDRLVCTVTDNGRGLGFTGTKEKSHRSYSGKGIIERVRVYNTLAKNKASFVLKDNNPGVSAILTLPYITRKQAVAV